MSLLGMGRSARYLRLAFATARATPVYLVMFITGQCNARCRHCLVPSVEEEHARGEELSVEEVEHLARHLGPDIYCLLLSGGEPFLRRDLADILEVLGRVAQLPSIKVVTNGFFTDHIVATWRRVLAADSDTYYGVTISFDGVGTAHDQIRGVQGLFEQATETYAQLQLLSHKHPNFEVDASITVSRFNDDHVLALYEHLRDTLQLGNVICTVTRGVPRDPGAADVRLERYRELKDSLAQDLFSGRLSGHRRFVRSDVVNAVNIAQRNRIAAVLDGRRRWRCNAGRLSGVIGCDGTVYACELRSEPLGQLRHHAYDLQRIWSSAEAQRTRSLIRSSRCCCTYENANLINVLFTPRHYPEIAGNVLRMQLGRRLAAWRHRRQSRNGGTDG